MAFREAPNGARRNRSTVFPTRKLDNLAQRDVDLLLDRPEDDAAINLDALGAAITTLALRGLLARVTQPRGRTHTHSGARLRPLRGGAK